MQYITLTDLDARHLRYPKVTGLRQGKGAHFIAFRPVTWSVIAWQKEYQVNNLAIHLGQVYGCLTCPQACSWLVDLLLGTPKLHTMLDTASALLSYSTYLLMATCFIGIFTRPYSIYYKFPFRASSLSPTSLLTLDSPWKNLPWKTFNCLFKLRSKALGERPWITNEQPYRHR